MSGAKQSPGVAFLDDVRRWVDVDRAAVAILGRDRAELLGARIDEIVAPAGVSLMRRLWHELERRGEIHAFCELQRVDGGAMLVEMEVRRDGGGRHRMLLHAVDSPPAARVTHASVLTWRELEILRLASLGLSNRAIAARVHVAPGTVKNHMSAIYRKLEVRDRAAAVAEALRQRLLD